MSFVLSKNSFVECLRDRMNDEGLMIAEYFGVFENSAVFNKLKISTVKIIIMEVKIEVAFDFLTENVVL